MDKKVDMDNGYQQNVPDANKNDNKRKDWLIFLSGALFIIAVWLLAKVLAWFIPSFRPIYNSIFVISVPTILYGGGGGGGGGGCV
jgi:hypothetical protein